MGDSQTNPIFDHFLPIISADNFKGAILTFVLSILKSINQSLNSNKHLGHSDLSPFMVSITFFRRTLGLINVNIWAKLYLNPPVHGKVLTNKYDNLLWYQFDSSVQHSVSSILPFVRSYFKICIFMVKLKSPDKHYF